LLITFADVYPYVSVFMTVEDADLVMLGSDRDIAPKLSVLEERLMRDQGLAAELGRVGLADPVRLLSTWQMDRTGVVAMCSKAPRNTDDNMRIEYGAPLNLHRSTAGANVRRLLSHSQLPRDVIEPADWMMLSREYLRRSDVDRALGAAWSAFERTGVALPEREAAFPLGANWEARLDLVVRAGDRVGRDPSAPSHWPILWARWRVAMLEYLGEDIPPGLLIDAWLVREKDRFVDLPLDELEPPAAGGDLD
jgi:hypothetical protein